MRILIIEDNLTLAKIVKDNLQKQGHAVDYLTDGEAGQRRIELHSQSYDVVVLDLLLPGKNGLDICKEVRKMGISIPILILTAKNDVEDKISLLDSGADDYLIKPFQFGELIARLRAITRRPKNVTPTVLSAGNIILDPAAKKVFVNYNEINLTLKEFRLLEYLMKHKKQVVEKEDIIENLWDFNFDSFSNVVDVYISKLRSKIDKQYGHKIIETVHGVGYRIND
jgi:DNA-binding response OmpR family regulator